MKHSYLINSIPFFFLLFFFLLNTIIITCLASDIDQLPSIVVDNKIGANDIQTYIIYLAKPEDSKYLNMIEEEELESWHKSFLPNTTLDSGEPRLIYSYSEVMTGFAARLTPDEVEAMQQLDGFLYAEADKQLHEPMTIYTPGFLGLNDPEKGLWFTQSNMGEGIVIGVIDTGIPRQHPSFSDDGMPAKPTNWEGTCNFANFTCNNKIIGAAEFNGGDKTSLPPVDIEGHGSHVASIAAGNFVKEAMFTENFNYTASGTAPRAHLAIYKITNKTSDHLKAYDVAIKDKVNIINYSQGVLTTRARTNFKNNTGCLGGYRAVERGIAVVAAAGNVGGAKTLSHYAPWLIVVGASTTDKRYGAAVELDNGWEFLGETWEPEQTDLFNQSFTGEIIFPGANNKNETLGCLSGSLNGFNVKDRIVLCRSGKNNTGKGRVVLTAGGAAMILMGPGPFTRLQSFVLPMSRVDSAVAEMILNYYRSTRSRGRTPTATITYKGLVPGRHPAPLVTGFSSRGPSEVNGGILKPDVIAPGVQILAASPNRSAPYDTYFRYDHGTSMAAPHVAGVVALIRKKYPTWSPAAIQSAIITSADDLDLSGRPIIDAKTDETANIFARGAGHINPKRAMDPGLVYDRNFSDYVGYMCALGCDSETMHMYSGREVNCTAEKNIKASQLNYPSIMVTLSSVSPNETVSRTVTNVGDVNSVYTPRIFHPAKASVILSTNKLQFSAHQRQASFDVFIRATPPIPVEGTISEGKLEWVSNNHVVRSPIAVVFD